MAISNTIGQLIGPTRESSSYSTEVKAQSELKHLNNKFSEFDQYSMQFDMNSGGQGTTYYFNQIVFPRDESIAIDYLVFLSQNEDLTNSGSNYIQIQDVYVTPSGSTISYVSTSFGTTITADGYNYVVIVPKSNSLDKDIREEGLATFANSLTNGVKKINTQGILPGSRWKKIGVQADPGFVYFVNGEPIMVGRSGFSETPDNYPISAVGFLNEKFICDYFIEIES